MLKKPRNGPKSGRGRKSEKSSITLAQPQPQAKDDQDKIPKLGRSDFSSQLERLLGD